MPAILNYRPLHLGFESASPTLIKTWDESYNALKTQIEENNFRSIDETGKVPPVCKWIEKQRKNYRENKLEKDQIAKLLSLGIHLESDRLIRTWDDSYEELKTQIENNEFRKTHESGRATSVNNWLTKQKKKYRENKLEKEQIDLWSHGKEI